MDINSFYLLGFNRTEVKLYLSLMEQGKCAAQFLAQKTKLPRSTVYSSLDSLAAKGLVKKEEKKGSTFFAVQDPSSIQSLVGLEKEKINKKEEIANSLVDQLRPLFKNKNYSVPKLEFIEGKRKVEKFLYDMLPVWRDSILKYEPVSTWGYQDHSFVGVYQNWIKDCWRVLHQEAKIQGQILSNISETESKLSGQIPRREVRVLDPSIEFSSSIWIMGDFIIMIMTRNEPYYAFQLHDSVFAGNLREVFQHLYSRGQIIDTECQ